jgi:hypothetical protein
MNTHEGRVRLQELRVAFEALAAVHDGFSVLPEPPAGDGAGHEFTLRLVGAGSPEVRLLLQSDAGDLTARSGSDHESAGVAEIRDRLGVELGRGFAWDDSVCASADELAGLLLKHMRRRLKSVGEVTPQG